jgi:hypothetical protein
MCSAIAALVCLVSWPHDAVDAGWKLFKHGNYGCAGCAAPMTCGMPMGCMGPGCYAPACAGCYGSNFHRPFAPLVAHYPLHYGAMGCYGPGCATPFFGCAAPMGCSCGVPMMGCAAPTYGMPMGADGDFDGAAMPYQPEMTLDGMPAISSYYAPVEPMSAPIPSVPPADDVVW